MGDRELRAALFRFVDVTPACRSLDDLARHLRGFLEEVPEHPPPVAAAMRISHTRAGRAALGAAAAAGVKHMAHRFIVAESPAAAQSALHGLWERGVASSVDLLGEATVTEPEADRYAARCDEALAQLAPAARRWPSAAGARARRRSGRSRGPTSRSRSPRSPRCFAPTLPSSVARCRASVCARCCAVPRSCGAHIHIDMESLDSREAVLDLVLELLDEHEFAGGPSAGLVLQAYLRDSPEQLTTILDWARSLRTPPLRSGWSRAPTGTTSWSRPASTAGPCPCSRSRPSATATSRRSLAGCSTRARRCGWRSPRTTFARSRTRSRSTGSGR